MNRDDALSVSMQGCQQIDQIADKIRHLFDTDHNPRFLPEDTDIRAIGCFDPFETAISIILGQLVSIQRATRQLEFSNNENLEEIEKTLLSVTGICSWSAQLIMMRCFQFNDAFPKNDLFIRRAVKKGLVDESLWKPGRAYLTHYLWSKATLPSDKTGNPL